MALFYKFKKEMLEDGTYVFRPRIFVQLNEKISIETPALIDTGSDMTIIPEGMAKAIGLKMEGKRTKFFGFRESNDVIESKANIIFLSRAGRGSIKAAIPVLIALSKAGEEEEQDIILGIAGIFDKFDITFKKGQNQIIFKEIAHKTY